MSEKCRQFSRSSGNFREIQRVSKKFRKLMRMLGNLSKMSGSFRDNQRIYKVFRELLKSSANFKVIQAGETFQEGSNLAFEKFWKHAWSSGNFPRIQNSENFRELWIFNKLSELLIYREFPRSLRNFLSISSMNFSELVINASEWFRIFSSNSWNILKILRISRRLRNC